VFQSDKNYGNTFQGIMNRYTLDMLCLRQLWYVPKNRSVCSWIIQASNSSNRSELKVGGHSNKMVKEIMEKDKMSQSM
jgi:hypothetical protein